MSVLGEEILTSHSLCDAPRRDPSHHPLRRKKTNTDSKKIFTTDDKKNEMNKVEDKESFFEMECSNNSTDNSDSDLPQPTAKEPPIAQDDKKLTSLLLSLLDDDCGNASLLPEALRPPLRGGQEDAKKIQNANKGNSKPSPFDQGDKCSDDDVLKGGDTSTRRNGSNPRRDPPSTITSSPADSKTIQRKAHKSKPFERCVEEESIDDVLLLPEVQVEVIEDCDDGGTTHPTLTTLSRQQYYEHDDVKGQPNRFIPPSHNNSHVVSSRLWSHHDKSTFPDDDVGHHPHDHEELVEGQVPEEGGHDLLLFEESSGQELLSGSHNLNLYNATMLDDADDRAAIDTYQRHQQDALRQRREELVALQLMYSKAASCSNFRTLKGIPERTTWELHIPPSIYEEDEDRIICTVEGKIQEKIVFGEEKSNLPKNMKRGGHKRRHRWRHHRTQEEDFGVE